MSARSEAAMQRHRQLWHENYEWYKAHGICPGCRLRWNAPGKVHCEQCLKETKQRKRRMDPDGGKQRAYNVERRARLKAAGLCVDCGRNEVLDRVRCPKCLAKARESRTAWEIRQRIQREAER